MAFARACAAVLASSLLGAQQMVVLGGPGRPSNMLGAWLSVHPERFVIADVGLWVHDLCGNDLASLWRKLEVQRRQELLATLTALCSHFGAADSRADGLAGVAHVARTLLAKERGGALRLPQPWRSEINAVIGGFSAPLACGRDGEIVDWAEAVPSGAYGARDGLDALFATTWYLRTRLGRFATEQARAWSDAVGQTAGSGSGELRKVDAALQVMFGTSKPLMPGVVGEVEWSAVADRHLLSTTTARPLAERLDAVHRREIRGGDDLRTSIFRVAHELATADPADEWLQAFGRARWRQKWSDLADHAYVAVREVDGIVGYRDIAPRGDRARLLIEPLPEVFAPLRAAYVAADDVARTAWGAREPRNEHRLAQIDDALALLAHQRAGTEPPAELVARMWQCLEHGFTEEGGDRVLTRLEGFDGVVRRSGCHLVHVPIRWQGRNEIAVAFHWFVEARERNGDWQRVRR